MTANEFNKNVIPLNNKLYHFANWLLKDEEEAKDATQEVFVKLWNIRKKLSSYQSIEAFAMRVTRNHCLDRIKARRTVSLDINNYGSNHISDEKDPENKMELSETVRTVQRLIEKLPDQQSLVIRLKDIQGYDFKEIEDMTGISQGNIRVLLSRARKKIREQLTSNDDGTERNKSIAAEIL